jgi:hypothetical protein
VPAGQPHITLRCPLDCHGSGEIMTKIQIELPDATATAAGEAGLLAPEALERLLIDALRRQQAADSLLATADRVAAAGIESMSMQEIDAEVKAVRAERRRAGGH